MIRALSFAAGAVAIVAASAIVLSGDERDAHNQNWLASTAQGALNLETNLKIMLAEDRGRRLRLDYAIARATERDYICRPGAAQAGRPSPEAWLKLRQEVFLKAGVSFPAHHADYEVDHIVPRCLDGPNTLDNLQLQLWPRARIKDIEEAEVCRTYCAGEITLEEARAKFRRD